LVVFFSLAAKGVYNVELLSYIVEREKAMGSAKPRIQSLGRASSIIDAIASGNMEGLSLGEICRSTELNKTTAFNLLSSLVTLRFVDQDKATRRYRLGLRNIELGRLVQHRLHIPEIARPVLVDLCRKTNETVSLAIPDHLDLLVIDSLNGSKYLQATAYTGSRSMYHCTALGKAVLSQRNEAMRQTIYRLSGLPKKTPHTITDVNTLEGQLPHIRAQGYALDAEENEVGVNCIGTTVRDGFGGVAAAISVTGPSNRWTAETIAHYSDDVVSASKRISRSLGFDG
jgi:IclR family acetate operon transcriptional repressor